MKALGPGYQADSGADQLHRRHERIGEQSGPESGVAEGGASLGVSGNARGIIIGCSGDDAERLRNAAWDVNLGMFFSNVVMYFIILATAATLHEAGETDIESAREAAEALRPLAGEAATILFALGLIGTGFLTVPILTTSAAYAIAETAGWKKHSLDQTPRGTFNFYAVIAAITLVALALNFSGINPIKRFIGRRSLTASWPVPCSS